ncbi:hypothetical protein CLTEP_04830 [Clostridium tepidiprofundi DSM 19306]|uniref:Uncharacterized protein n=1 Tax=Clostridium tepidiprofundi DSM 19306 TaxID=1121338 RepID=A0A151B6N0_9CLOT|nr:hypothetical protein [Clostridium tepidiprofundi]KYH35544.1 hypothetical protein CLTEP_04830 [Clostridium tepidiprofundi DSM 19306]
MRKRVLGIVLLIVCSLLLCMYKSNMNIKLDNKEKTEIISLVNSYYNRLMNRDYRGTLELIDLSKTDYNKAYQSLSNNNGYKIQQRLEANHWIIPVNSKYDYICYDKKNKSFVILIGANIINNGKRYAVTERVYVKKIGWHFKIIKITTDDRFGYIRGSFVSTF